MAKLKNLKVGMRVRAKKRTFIRADLQGQAGTIRGPGKHGPWDWEVYYDNGQTGQADSDELKILKEDWVDEQGYTHHVNGDVSIPMDIPDHELLDYALLAHEEGITLNQWMVNAVTSALKRAEVLKP